MAVGVDMRVDRDLVTDESDLWRLKRVLGAELKLEAKLLAVVQGVRWTAHFHSPSAQITSLCCCLFILPVNLKWIETHIARLLPSSVSCAIFIPDGGLATMDIISF